MGTTELATVGLVSDRVWVFGSVLPFYEKS